MIEYKTDKNKPTSHFMEHHHWMKWSVGFKMGEFRFEFLKFRINGVEYTEYSEKFRNEYNKLVLWYKITEKG